MSKSICQWESHIQQAEKFLTDWQNVLKTANKDNNKELAKTAKTEIAEMKSVIKMAKANIKKLKK
jgi:preprotein translocase subunit Sss1